LISLDGIEQFKNLKLLAINFNNIQSHKELQKVSKSLRELDFRSNPKSSKHFTTKNALETFPYLRRFNGEQVRESQ
jgi:hypothetical protein